MKLWLVRRTDPIGYDEWDAVVVAAETQDDAQYIHPSPYLKVFSQHYGWAKAETLSVEYLGTTDRKIEGVVLASFNAG